MEEFLKDGKTLQDMRDILIRETSRYSHNLKAALDEVVHDSKMMNHLLLKASITNLMATFLSTTTFDIEEDKIQALPFLFQEIEDVWDMTSRTLKEKKVTSP